MDKKPFIERLKKELPELKKSGWSKIEIDTLLKHFSFYLGLINGDIKPSSDKQISLKSVVNTNNCFVHLYLHENTLLITSCIDNLIKGASGQAIQNTNLMMGWKETLGLELKATIY